MIEVLYQDDDFIIVNKPAHMLVHPYKEAKDIKENLLKTLRDQVGLYLYPIHRLDRPVSGIIAFGLNKEATKNLSENWHEVDTVKKYITLVRTQFKEAGEFNFDLNDHKKRPKTALTLYTPLQIYTDSTLMEVEIKTGRYHQIRRHFSRSVRHVLGDRTYGKKKYNDHYLENFGLERIFLHSHHLKFKHPRTKNLIEITSSLPLDLANVLEKLESSKVSS